MRPRVSQARASAPHRRTSSRAGRAKSSSSSIQHLGDHDAVLVFVLRWAPTALLQRSYFFVSHAGLEYGNASHLQEAAIPPNNVVDGISRQVQETLAIPPDHDRSIDVPAKRCTDERKNGQETEMSSRSTACLHKVDGKRQSATIDQPWRPNPNFLGSSNRLKSLVGLTSLQPPKLGG